MNKLSTMYNSLAKPAKAALWYLVCGILQKGIAIIVTPIFTRLLSTTEYGQYTLFNSWLEILGVVITLRLSYGVFMQGLVRYDYDKDEYTSALMGLTTLLVLVAFAIYLPLRTFWNTLTGLNTFLMVCCLTSIWAVAIFDFWATRQRVECRYRALIIVTLLVALITPTAGVFAVISTEVMKVEARVGVIVAVELVFYFGFFINYMSKGRCFFNRDHWLHALKYNLPLIPHYLSRSVLNQSDRIMINALINSSAAGIYGLAHSLAWVMSVVNQALVNAMNPWIYSKIKEGDYGSIAQVSYLAIVIVGVANIVLIAFAPEAVMLFAPAEYYDAVWLVPPLSASVFLMFAYSLFADFEFYYERTGLVMIASITGAIVNIVLNVIFIPLFGYFAAGYTTLISFAVYIAMHYCFMRHVQRTEMNGARVYSLKVLFLLSAAFAVLAIVAVLLYPNLIARLILLGVLLIIVIWKRESIIAMYNTVRNVD